MQNSKLRIIQKFKNLYHLGIAIVANIYYWFPSRKLKIIGVTGTDGKTTTTHLIYHILKSSAKRVSMVSSVYANIAGKIYNTGFHVTTPDPFAVQKFLNAAVNNNDEYFVLETTSHAIDQNRIWGIKYHIGVVTNITHEHLDYHQSYEEYVKTKAKLLLVSKTGIINHDDKSYPVLKKICQRNKTSFKSYKGDLSILKTFTDLTSFNKYNYAAAYTVCHNLSISDKMIISAMKSFKLPSGRLETVYDKKFKIIIDFAHTPNAIFNILKSIKDKHLTSSGKLIHIFGSAGLRDSSKRPLMGKSSAEFSDIVILTEEDYRTEDPYKISEQIAEGLLQRGFVFKTDKLIDQSDKKIYTIIINRQEAIRYAITLADKKDVIVITGKGHEKSLCRGNTEYPWDDKKAVSQALQKK